jgi:predicted amidohydrolase
MNWRRALQQFVFPARGDWRWILVRLAIVAALLVVFRYEVVSWSVAAHNRAWKTWTRSSTNRPGDMAFLASLRGPGLRMLLRLGEATKLADMRDPAAVPALADLALGHPEARIRQLAIQGLQHFRDERAFMAFNRALDDGDRSVRRAAVAAFGEMGEPHHQVILQSALAKETDRAVRVELQRSILLLTSRTENTSRPTVLVAAIQFASEFNKAELNRKRLTPLIREAASRGAKIVVLPETAVQGYLTYDIHTGWFAEGFHSTEGIKDVPARSAAEEVPGPSTDYFRQLSKELGIYLTVPILEVEKSSGRFFNALCLVDPEGTVLLHYRKRNPWPYAEDGWCSKGDRGLQTVDTPYGRLGLLICYDINFEPDNLHRLGIDTLLYSIAWVDDPKSPWFDVRLPRIARNHDFNIIAANWTIPRDYGWSGYGQSRIIARTGRVLAKAPDDLKEAIVYARLGIPR